MPLKIPALLLAFFIPVVQAESIDKAHGKNPAGDWLGSTSMATSTTTFMTSEPSNRRSQYTAAKPDALAFVASQGDIRGAYFEQALLHYRSGRGHAQVSDLQFAQAVAAVQ